MKDRAPPQNIRSHGGLTDETGVVSLSKEETDVPRWWRLRDKIQELNLKPNWIWINERTERFEDELNLLDVCQERWFTVLS